MASTYEKFVATVTEAANMIGLKENDYISFLTPEKELSVYIPVKMDDGTKKIFKGHRIQHSTLRGPAKGGIRFHPNVNIDEVRSLAGWMTFKCTIADIPYGGGKGGISVDPYKLSERELEQLTRTFMKMIAKFIGPNIDIPAPDVGTNPQVMAWMLDTYSTIAGQNTPAIITGKPVPLGGSLGRFEATGRGVMFACQEILNKLDKKLSDQSIVIQGLGNVGSITAKLFAQEGAKIIAVSDVSGGIYNKNGLDIKSILDHISKKQLLDTFKGDFTSISNEELLTLETDVLIPAALENQITTENAEKINTKLIIEAANGPTTPEADSILEKRNIICVPDVFANGGGVIVSYFEWIQNLQHLYWSEKEVNERLHDKMSRAFDLIWKVKNEYNTTLRKACYIKALKDLVDTQNAKGV